MATWKLPFFSGLRYVRDVEEQGAPCRLMRIDRP